MEENKKWKSRLLSSSLPLESEVSKILQRNKYAVTFDYPYSRGEGTDTKDFSIDLRGMSFIDSDNKCSHITALIECKFREEGKSWIFLPDTNEEFSVFTLGSTLRHLDHFSQIKIKTEGIYEFESNLSYGLKGVEVSTKTGEVFDKDIIHGISQLKYGLPYALRFIIQNNCHCHIEDAHVEYLLPILVTNAELRIFDEELSINSVANANTLDDISTTVDCLICHSENSPDFLKHSESVFKDFFVTVHDSENLAKFEGFHRTKKNNFGIYSSPIEYIKGLEWPNYNLQMIYSQFFVCNVNYLNQFIVDVNDVIRTAM